MRTSQVLHNDRKRPVPENQTDATSSDSGSDSGSNSGSNSDDECESGTDGSQTSETESSNESSGSESGLDDVPSASSSARRGRPSTSDRRAVGNDGSAKEGNGSTRRGGRGRGGRVGRGGRGGKACRPAGQLGAVRLAVGSPDWLLARRVDLHSKRVRKRLWLDGASGAPVTVHGPHTDDETLMIQYGLAYDGWGVLQLGRRTLKAAHQLILWRHVASCGIGNARHRGLDANRSDRNIMETVISGPTLERHAAALLRHLPRWDIDRLARAIVSRGQLGKLPPIQATAEPVRSIGSALVESGGLVHQESTVASEIRVAAGAPVAVAIGHAETVIGLGGAAGAVIRLADWGAFGLAMAIDDLLRGVGVTLSRVLRWLPVEWGNTPEWSQSHHRLGGRSNLNDKDTKTMLLGDLACSNDFKASRMQCHERDAERRLFWRRLALRANAEEFWAAARTVTVGDRGIPDCRTGLATYTSGFHASIGSFVWRSCHNLMSACDAFREGHLMGEELDQHIADVEWVMDRLCQPTQDAVDMVTPEPLQTIDTGSIRFFPPSPNTFIACMEVLDRALGSLATDDNTHRQPIRRLQDNLETGPAKWCEHARELRIRFAADSATLQCLPAVLLALVEPYIHARPEAIVSLAAPSRAESLKRFAARCALFADQGKCPCCENGHMHESMEGYVCAACGAILRFCDHCSDSTEPMTLVGHGVLGDEEKLQCLPTPQQSFQDDPWTNSYRAGCAPGTVYHTPNSQEIWLWECRNCRTRCVSNCD